MPCKAWKNHNAFFSLYGACTDTSHTVGVHKYFAALFFLNKSMSGAVCAMLFIRSYVEYHKVGFET